jgi:hypothetical protein
MKFTVVEKGYWSYYKPKINIFNLKAFVLGNAHNFTASISPNQR